MHETSVFWLRIALALYFVGLVHAVVTLVRKRSAFFEMAHSAFVVGVILHVVSLVDASMASGHLPVGDFQQTVSACAFVIALVFQFVWWRYQFEPLSLILFPLVFFMTMAGLTEQATGAWPDARVRSVWLVVHVLTILLGYAALLITAAASMFYLVRERQLKAKTNKSSLFDHLPPLGTLDGLITGSLGICFGFFTVGVLAGITWAFIEYGTRWVGEARIIVGLITWGFCLLAVFLRNTVGWRGRKAALLSIALTGCAVVTWASHVGLRSFLPR